MRGRETSMCGCLSHASHTPLTGDLAPQPRHVPWLGIELSTLWSAGGHWIHWATPARAQLTILQELYCGLTNCISLAAYKILSLSLTFCILYDVSWCGPLWVHLVSGSLCFLDLYIYFLYQVMEVCSSPSSHSATILTDFTARSYGYFSFWHWNSGLGEWVWDWDPSFLRGNLYSCAILPDF